MLLFSVARDSAHTVLADTGPVSGIASDKAGLWLLKLLELYVSA